MHGRVRIVVMKAVVQRVSEASVTIDGAVTARIGRGVLVLLGVEKGDGDAEASWLAGKIAGLRMFPDGDGKMNLSVGDAGGSALVVSQFTIAGNCAKGRRPSFDTAAPPDDARRLYERFVRDLAGHGLPVGTGVFQADMQVALVNDGPVTFIVEKPPATA